jgi:hypothetical protein
MRILVGIEERLVCAMALRSPLTQPKTSSACTAFQGFGQSAKFGREVNQRHSGVDLLGLAREP